MRVRFDFQLNPDQNEFTGMRDFQGVLTALILNDHGRAIRKIHYSARGFSKEETLRKTLEGFFRNEIFNEETIYHNEYRYQNPFKGKAEFEVKHLPDIIRIPLLQILDVKIKDFQPKL